MSATERDLAVRAQVDVYRAERDVGITEDRHVVLAGDRVFVRGWAFDPLGGNVEVEALIGDRRIPLARGFPRLDVAEWCGPQALNAGFEAWLEGVSDTPGRREIRLVRHARNERDVPIGEPLGITVTAKPLEPVSIAADGATGRIRELVDTGTEGVPFGWTGRRSVRRHTAVAVRGWVVDPAGRPPAAVMLAVAGEGESWCFPAELRWDGEATRIAAAGAFRAGFSVALDAALFVPGLYEATVLGNFGDGRWVRGPHTWFQGAPEPPFPAPLYLPYARQTAPAAVERAGPLRPARGEPIVVEGWAVDPSTSRGGPVYVAFDELRPLPVPSRLSGAREPAPFGASRFAGIADTRDLRPGAHRLRIMLLSSGGALWHILAEREVEVTAT